MVNKDPLISIITVVYNGEQYVEQCINSVLNQGYKNIQYIIIDGGSTDGTLDVINNYIESIDILISENDNGISDAFNKGISKAKGEIIGILNSDDLYTANAVQTIVDQFIDNDYSSGIYYGNIEYFDSSKSIELTAEAEKLWKFMSIYHPATFVTSDVYDKIGGYSEEYKYAMDCEFIHRSLFNKISFYHVNSILAKFRLAGTSDINYVKSQYEFYKSVKKYNYHVSAKFYLYWAIAKKHFLRTRIGKFLDKRRNLISWVLSGKYKTVS